MDADAGRGRTLVGEAREEVALVHPVALEMRRARRGGEVRRGRGWETRDCAARRAGDARCDCATTETRRRDVENNSRGDGGARARAYQIADPERSDLAVRGGCSLGHGARLARVVLGRLVRWRARVGGGCRRATNLARGYYLSARSRPPRRTRPRLARRREPLRARRPPVADRLAPFASLGRSPSVLARSRPRRASCSARASKVDFALER